LAIQAFSAREFVVDTLIGTIATAGRSWAGAKARVGHQEDKQTEHFVFH
jgi:hypothetical protein